MNGYVANNVGWMINDVVNTSIAANSRILTLFQSIDNSYCRFELALFSLSFDSMGNNNSSISIVTLPMPRQLLTHNEAPLNIWAFKFGFGGTNGFCDALGVLYYNSPLPRSFVRSSWSPLTSAIQVFEAEVHKILSSFHSGQTITHL